MARSHMRRLFITWLICYKCWWESSDAMTHQILDIYNCTQLGFMVENNMQSLTSVVLKVMRCLESDMKLSNWTIGEHLWYKLQHKYNKCMFLSWWHWLMFCVGIATHIAAVTVIFLISENNFNFNATRLLSMSQAIKNAHSKFILNSNILQSRLLMVYL